MNLPPAYQGKPTLYLDHNILDFFVKNGVGEWGEHIAESFQIVYSDENLKEIKGSVGYEECYLSVLKNLGAYHLKVALDSRFKATGKAMISDKDVHEAYSEYCETLNPTYEALQKNMQMGLQKAFGGQADVTFEDIQRSQQDMLKRLFEELEEQLEELDDRYSFLAAAFRERVSSSLQQAELASKESVRLLNSNVENQIGWSGVKDIRAHMDLGPIKLNNIKPPQVIEQIWELVKDREGIATFFSSPDDFFRIVSNPIYPGEEYYPYQKVNAIYTHLNMLGYYPDSGLHRERRFTAAMSDQSHASIASFADALASRDEAFIKKVSAAYEYLGIKTAVFHVKLSVSKD